MNTLPKAKEIHTDMIVDFEVMPKTANGDQLVRLYHALFTGAHYVSLESFNKYFEELA